MYYSYYLLAGNKQLSHLSQDCDALVATFLEETPLESTPPILPIPPATEVQSVVKLDYFNESEFWSWTGHVPFQSTIWDVWERKKKLLQCNSTLDEV